MTREATVYVVDDDDNVRRSLQWLIEPLGVKVKACASAQAFLDCFDPNDIACVILDVRMPDMSGLELQERMAAHGWNLPVIFISGHADVPMSVRALKAGAFDFLEKPFNRQELVDRLQRAITLARDQQEKLAARSVVEARFALLTDRERQVLDRVLTGKLNKQIASELRISVRTVEVHRANVMTKLRAESLLELAKVTARFGDGTESLH